MRRRGGGKSAAGGNKCMLYEVAHVRQHPDDVRRRWFTDPTMDLILWVDERDRVLGFQLCYDRGQSQHAISWFRNGGYMHHRVDDGEGRPGRPKSTPLMAVGGVFPRDGVAASFRQRSARMPSALADLVYRKIAAYPGGRPVSDAASNGHTETEGTP